MNFCVVSYQKSYNPLYSRCFMKGEEHKFKLKSKYKPAGEQPKAIKELVENVKGKNSMQTLLGVTGSGLSILRWSFCLH